MKDVTKAKYGYAATNVGDGGAFAPNIGDNWKALELLNATIAKAGYKGGENIKIRIDVGASKFYIDRQNTIQTQEIKKIKELTKS